MNGLQKLYIGLWAVFTLTIVVAAFTTGLTSMVLTVLGFTAFGLVFMGMMCVLPSTVAHPADNAVQAQAQATEAKSWSVVPAARNEAARDVLKAA